MICLIIVDSTYDSFQSWSPLTEEGYTEKLKLLREASTIPMERWKASAVLAWIEIALGMPQYGPKCAENVKSGKVSISFEQKAIAMTSITSLFVDRNNFFILNK